ncbi:signal peptidase I [Heyndrickxia faecalis]|uniref:signal peptidase I n=1 Tax=Heyndrickxia faecalis TaxID=2824910 RepID=UPI00359540CC
MSKGIKTLLKSFIFAILLVAVIRGFFIAPYMVEGESMEPTLHNHDKILVYKVHSAADYQRGDIIIIKGETENYVKRIIGLPGDTILVKNDHLYINGKLRKEPYLAKNLKAARKKGSKLTNNFGPLTVPKNKYFVMGDNRLYSEDSRNGLGLIPKKELVGKTEAVFYPLSQIREVR